MGTRTAVESCDKIQASKCASAGMEDLSPTTCMAVGVSCRDLGCHLALTQLQRPGLGASAGSGLWQACEG